MNKRSKVYKETVAVIEKYGWHNVDAVLFEYGLEHGLVEPEYEDGRERP